MARKNNNKQRRNAIQNVRMVDPDEGSDDAKVSNMISAYSTSVGQVRVVCAFQQDVVLTQAGSTTYGWDTLTATDDFISFAAQYLEFRVRGIRFDVFDIQPNSAPVINYLATFHQIAGNVPSTPADIVDRPDSRSIVPGTGRTRLAWLAHGQPEMEFQSTTSYDNYGGLVFYTSAAAAITGAKYTLIGKYIVDFRGRR